jgi:hypothetical protein
MLGKVLGLPVSLVVRLGGPEVGQGGGLEMGNEDQE